MKCPYCGEEMQQGYIQSRDGVYWTEKKLIIPAVVPLGGGKYVKLSQESTAIAYFCKPCKKVIMNIDE